MQAHLRCGLFATQPRDCGEHDHAVGVACSPYNHDATQQLGSNAPRPKLHEDGRYQELHRREA